MNATEFLKSKGLIKEGFSRFVITNDEFGEIDLADLMNEFTMHARTVPGYETKIVHGRCGEVLTKQYPSVQDVDNHDPEKVQHK